MNILSLSYGKDSIASIEAMKQLNLSIDKIIHAEIWATDTIPGELPPMVEFKKYADAEILKRYNLKVEHIRSKYTFQDLFYRVRKKGAKAGQILGFPIINGNWCTEDLKKRVLNTSLNNTDNKILGIAADESKRIKRHTKPNIILPLVQLDWTEQYCFDWCKENNLLSPVYSNTFRGGCWFCYNQSIGQMRYLWKNYPYLWNLLKKWEYDSPVTLKYGHMLTEYEKRFIAEEAGEVPNDKRFKWEMLK